MYHATARGVDRCAIFRDDDDRRFFLRLLAPVVERHLWHCHALCLMDNHYHVVVETYVDLLATGMRRLNGAYAQRFNRRHRRTGHLFGDRYHAWIISTERHLRATCRYVLLNPVRAGLCERAEDWRWSSARAQAVTNDEPTSDSPPTLERPFDEETRR